jgi:hypothetical protein
MAPQTEFQKLVGMIRAREELAPLRHVPLDGLRQAVNDLVGARVAEGEIEVVAHDLRRALEDWLPLRRALEGWEPGTVPTIPSTDDPPPRREPQRRAEPRESKASRFFKAARAHKARRDAAPPPDGKPSRDARPPEPRPSHEDPRAPREAAPPPEPRARREPPPSESKARREAPPPSEARTRRDSSPPPEPRAAREPPAPRRSAPPPDHAPPRQSAARRESARPREPEPVREARPHRERRAPPPPPPPLPEAPEEPEDLYEVAPTREMPRVGLVAAACERPTVSSAEPSSALRAGAAWRWPLLLFWATFLGGVALALDSVGWSPAAALSALGTLGGTPSEMLARALSGEPVSAGAALAAAGLVGIALTNLWVLLRSSLAEA